MTSLAALLCFTACMICIGTQYAAPHKAQAASPGWRDRLHRAVPLLVAALCLADTFLSLFAGALAPHRRDLHLAGLIVAGGLFGLSLGVAFGVWPPKAR